MARGVRTKVTNAATSVAASEARAAAHPARARRASVAEPTSEQMRNPLQSRRRIEDMLEDELRTYARQLGLTKRDATELTIDRLRQNCKARLFDLIDDV